MIKKWAASNEVSRNRVTAQRTDLSILRVNHNDKKLSNEREFSRSN